MQGVLFDFKGFIRAAAMTKAASFLQIQSIGMKLYPIDIR